MLKYDKFNKEIKVVDLCSKEIWQQKTSETK